MAGTNFRKESTERKLAVILKKASTGGSKFEQKYFLLTSTILLLTNTAFYTQYRTECQCPIHHINNSFWIPETSGTNVQPRCNKKFFGGGIQITEVLYDKLLKFLVNSCALKFAF